METYWNLPFLLKRARADIEVTLLLILNIISLKTTVGPYIFCHIYVHVYMCVCVCVCVYVYVYGCVCVCVCVCLWVCVCVR